MTAILGLILLCAGIEAVLVGSDAGLWGVPRLRQTVYEYGGFWPGLLRNWQPNFPGQAAAMFFTYAFLHGGPGHMAINMVTLWSLGRGVADRVGTAGFCLIYGGSVLGGAAGYALLARTPQPMVGASGALFGLAGALLAWTYLERPTRRDGLWTAGRIALFLVAINLAMYWALDGQLAWQTHLGGGLSGWALGLLTGPAGRPADLRGQGEGSDGYRGDDDGGGAT